MPTNQPIILASWSHQRQLSLAIDRHKHGWMDRPTLDPWQEHGRPCSIRIDPMWRTIEMTIEEIMVGRKKTQEKTQKTTHNGWFLTKSGGAFGRHLDVFVSRLILILRGAIEEDWGLGWSWSKLQFLFCLFFFVFFHFFFEKQHGCVCDFVFRRFVPRSDSGRCLRGLGLVRCRYL